MQWKITLIIFIYSVVGLAQTDTMFVQMMDGTTLSYSTTTISQIYFVGNVTNVREKKLIQNVIPTFQVYQNYPNPFNPTTTIEYNIPKPGNVKIGIYNIQGQLIRTLFSNFQQAGLHSIIWDSQNNLGTNVASGIYFYQIKFNSSILVKKLMLIK